MNSARVSRSAGSLLQSNAIASRRRLPVSGKIRPGIKILTQAAAKVQGASDLYQQGLAEGLSFDQIAAKLKSLQGCPSYPLTPRNAPYFTVRQDDFSTPGAAQAILDRYGSVLPGDPVKRLYSFPVILPSDDLDLIFREQFEAWKASELHRWSEPDPQTGQVMCLRRAVAAPDPQAKRRWGGRPTEVDRACDPNDCALFAKGDCKHSGALSFWIPGITGVGVIEMHFTSIYASLGIAETLDMVRMGLGRISGLLPNGEPIFWISKRRDRVSRMDWEKGRSEKSDQWIIQIEAVGLDMAQVLSGALALPAPPAAAPALAAPQSPDAAHEPVHEPVNASRPTPDDGPASHASAAGEQEPAAKSGPSVAELRKHLSALANSLGWDNDDLADWVTHNYGGTDAARNPDALVRMIADLTAMAERETARAAAQTTMDLTQTACESAAEPATSDEAPF